MTANARFDALCKALEVKHAKEAIAEYNLQLATGVDLDGNAITDEDRAFIARMIKGQRQRLARAKKAQREWWR